jgi:prepilin-type processing-associated H-X9-DG protein
VLVDEDVHNLNDAAFAFGMEHPQWIDAPGTYHNGGCGFAFADGHSETHRWQSPTPKKGHRAPVISPQDLIGCGCGSGLRRIPPAQCRRLGNSQPVPVCPDFLALLRADSRYFGNAPV